MWQELLGAREEIVNQIGKSLHEWSKIVLLVKKKKKRLYMHRLCLEENATNWQHGSFQWKQAGGRGTDGRGTSSITPVGF